jgi:SPASM domain peptide maturase of grasp-with-spasm system
MEKYFCLYSDCKIVKGHSKSLILDLTKREFHHIPNSIVYILKSLKDNNFYSFQEDYSEVDKEIINDYFNWLIEKDLGFWTSTLEEYNNFIFTESDFLRPYIVENIIIEYNECFDLNYITEQIIKLNIPFIELRFYKKISYNFLFEFLQNIKESNIEGIDLIIKYNNEIRISQLKKIILSELRINNFIITNYNKERILSFYNGLSKIKFTTKKIQDNKNCGIVDNKYLTINKNMYLESLNHNSCLHKKISIDVNGNIKNCPSMPQSFGNIKDTTLEEAIEHPDFKKYWNITKDQIEVCKDCEFRHICTDCRAYTERTHFQEDIDLSKPLKCGYNPYTNEWAEWSTNPLKQKAIAYYGMQELVKKDA